MRTLVKKEEVAFVTLDLGEVIRDVARLVHSDALCSTSMSRSN